MAIAIAFDVQDTAEMGTTKSKRGNLIALFLAVQNSSIGDLVTHSLTHSLTD